MARNPKEPKIEQFVSPPEGKIHVSFTLEKSDYDVISEAFPRGFCRAMRRMARRLADQKRKEFGLPVKGVAAESRPRDRRRKGVVGDDA